MRIMLLLLTLLPMLLQAEVTILGSKEAEYDGQVVTLSGHAEIAHPFGTIRAEKIMMLPWGSGESQDYPLIRLFEKIQISLQDGGELKCDLADIDYRRLNGVFWCNQENAHVRYLETYGEEATFEVTSEKMHLSFEREPDDQYAVQSILCEGQTEFKYSDKEERTHHLACTGEVVIDQRQHIATLTNLNPEKLVHFQDSYGEIASDKAIVYYRMVNERLLPEKIVLTGHVCMKNECPGIAGEQVHLQYAVADEAEYRPDSHTLRLLSREGKRVLLYDKINSLHVSASELKIHRDEVTEKDSIKGVGDVRFSFKEGEFEKLQNHMLLGGSTSG